MATVEHDLVIIGGGPAGYVAAIRGAQLGLNVACVEQESALGGTCLRVGCIPSKALLESSEQYVEAAERLSEHGVTCGEVDIDVGAMMNRKNKTVRILTRGIDGLFRKNKVARYRGTGRLVGGTRVHVEGDDAADLEGRWVLVATGSRPAELPGVELDHDRIGTSTEALNYAEPPEHLVVIGAGFIGLELGSVWARLGSQVTVLEYLDRILPPMDGETAQLARAELSEQGLDFHLGVRVTGAHVEGDECLVETEGQDTIRCSHVLQAVGRAPNTEGLGAEEAGLELDERGRVRVDEHYATNLPNVYAVGDVIAGPMLAHKAEEEGVACVEGIVNGYGHVNYDAIPGVVYTDPEVAAVGKTEEQLSADGIPYRKGSFPFRANGRARSMGAMTGQVKILAHAETDRVLGVHIIGPRAGDLIAEAVAAIEFGASSEDLARTSHAHPSLAEAIKEAALAVEGRALHV